MWTGSLCLGLVNIPVRAVPPTRDRGVHFRMIHKVCNTTIKCCKVCLSSGRRPLPLEEGGLRLTGVDGNEYVVFDR